MASRFLFTSESVTEGHPDKICDQISDTILDTLLAQDPRSRVAAEVVVNTGLVLITGEITTKAHVNYVDIARKKIAEIGYIDADNGFSANSCAVMVALDEQSPDIAQGVNVALEARTGAEEDAALEAVGAGDQGIMFGFACDETPEFMPMPIAIAHRLARQLSVVRKNGTLAYLRPDGKTQVTVVYEGDKPVAIDTILISTQHDAAIDGISDEAKVQEKIKDDLWTHVVLPSFADTSVKPNDHTRYLVNPTGKFVIGGPQGDSGLTGRKIIVDTYGGYARHGGGAFSGKDPTKVDRSAAYAARHAAKNIVAAGLASKCELQISYAIGVARPTSMHIDTFGTGKVDEETLLRLVKDHFDLRPAAIIKNFDLQNLPSDRKGRFYQDVAAYGHMGRNDLDLPWERLDKVEILKKNA
ncbi:methionine adenosyltransferase [Pseudanabaena sp. SR411]|uniref:methionine adenosyltransferase n=1 Tax=Pseudanabaena sp. SR411 TaxID=1980935 RepID=UPI000B99A6AA|nr:methionine adenosyltransferase [Pseudanabaena sp. SR411]OYQ63001.1 methionine adenosyltransferase [Pseudanabaena sp. SR411]